MNGLRQRVAESALERARQSVPRSAEWRTALLVRICLTSEPSIDHARQAIQDVDGETEATIAAALQLLDELAEAARVPV